MSRLGKYIRKILAAWLVAVLAAALACPGSAATLSRPQASSFGDWSSRAGGLGGPFRSVTGYAAGKTCPSSSDSYHHGSKSAGFGDDGDGLYHMYECEYCHQEFRVGESDSKQSYDDHVAELPAPGYSSSGELRWRMNVYDCIGSNGTSSASLDFHGGTRFSFLLPYGENITFLFSGFNAPVTGNYSLYYSFSCAYKFRLVRLRSYSIGNVYILTGDGRDNPLLFGSGLDPNARIDSGVLKRYDKTTGVSFFAGDVIFGQDDYFRIEGSNEQHFYPASGYWELTCTPVTLPGDSYDITSRPTSITGDYGIIGDNGQITQVEGDAIVNETNSTVYNPVTGGTSTMDDWQYDYSTRTYTVTLENGTTQTITYGDEKITILEGDTTYNVYYLTEGSGTGEPDPGPDTPTACDHAWTETSRTEATCTTAGKVFSTCSKCGQTKTETVPALGHTWTVDRTVQTTYDEQGNLIQQGYTIYRCTVCGEQYKDMEGTGPPGEEEEKSIWQKIGDLIGTGFSGIVDIVESIAKKVLDALTSLVELLMGKLKAVVESVLSIFDEVPALFGGFLDFLAAIFPFLPPEITVLLTFGIAAIVFIGIIKAIRR